jgi:hypothetical protein
MRPCRPSRTPSSGAARCCDPPLLGFLGLFWQGASSGAAARPCQLWPGRGRAGRRGRHPVVRGAWGRPRFRVPVSDVGPEGPAAARCARHAVPCGQSLVLLEKKAMRLMAECCAACLLPRCSAVSVGHAKGRCLTLILRPRCAGMHVRACLSQNANTPCRRTSLHVCGRMGCHPWACECARVGVCPLHTS